MFIGNLPGVLKLNLCVCGKTRNEKEVKYSSNAYFGVQGPLKGTLAERRKPAEKQFTAVTGRAGLNCRTAAKPVW